MAITLKSSNGLEHPSVQNVIKIAEEILSENKILDANLLYITAKRRLKIPRQGLLSIIRMLINRKILVEGSKFTKKSLLSNRYRNNIYYFIVTHLGAHYSLIRKEILSDERNIGSAGQLIWHLEMLLKFNYIKKVKTKNYTIFLPIEVDEESGIFYFLLRDDITKKIVDCSSSKIKLKEQKFINLLTKKEKMYIIE